MATQDDWVYYYCLTESGELYTYIRYTLIRGIVMVTTNKYLGATGIDLTGANRPDSGVTAASWYDAESGFLIIAKSVKDEKTTLFAVNPSTLETIDLTNFGDNAVSVVSLYHYTPTQSATGSTNAVSAVATRQRPEVDVQSTGMEATDEAVTLTLTEDVDVTNGRITVTYDPAVLTYLDLTSAAGLTAVNAGEGEITFAYATTTPVKAGDTLATLRFGYVGDYADTDITVETTQRNTELDLSETVTVEVVYEVGDHDYQLVESLAPICTEAGYEVWTCTKCGDSYRVELEAIGHSTELVNAKEATCTEDGYTGDLVCTVCGETLEQGEVIPAYCPSEAFSDLDTTQWYHEGVDFVLENGLMVGMSDTEFAPNGNVTRAQLVTILYRLEGQPSIEGLENPFEDVTEKDWFYDAVVWAASEGVVNGTSETTFDPNAAITREQIAAILFRYSGAEKVEEDHLEAFVDADKISAYAVDAMNWAVANGLIKGLTETTVAPRATATRAQIATILMRYCAE